MRLWEFQNGKMGVYKPKIDWDTANNVKCKILKNDSFNKVKHNFLTKTAIFSKFGFLHFLLYLGQFLGYNIPFYLFGILKVWSLRMINGFSGFFQIRDAMK